MTRRSDRIVSAAAAIALLAGAGLYARATSQASAAPPRLIPYTGHLDHDGNPVTGSVAMKVCLITDPATACDAAPWSEMHGAVAVAGGRFSVTLGESVPIGDDTFKSAPATPLYVRVMVGASNDAGATFVQLNGAQRVLSTPYAINAEQAAKMRIDGPIHSGAATPASAELGLYSETAAGGVRIVTN